MTYDYFKSLGMNEDSIQGIMLLVEFEKEVINEDEDDDSIQKFKIKLLDQLI
jgi:hypothetical protein